ncbi:MAG: hypothetical protein QXG39_09000 [Candidatus Aenigmatarchaeota archaeon]
MSLDIDLDIDDEILAVESTLDHYSKILTDTELLLQYASVFETGSLFDAIKSIVRWLDILEERLIELEKQKSEKKLEKKE